MGCPVCILVPWFVFHLHVRWRYLLASSGNQVSRNGARMARMTDVAPGRCGRQPPVLPATVSEQRLSTVSMCSLLRLQLVLIPFSSRAAIKSGSSIMWWRAKTSCNDASSNERFIDRVTCLDINLCLQCTLDQCGTFLEKRDIKRRVSFINMGTKSWDSFNEEKKRDSLRVGRGDVGA